LQAILLLKAKAKNYRLAPLKRGKSTFYRRVITIWRANKKRKTELIPKMKQRRLRAISAKENNREKTNIGKMSNDTTINN
jgi:hypothetical protein